MVGGVGARHSDAGGVGDREKALERLVTVGDCMIELHQSEGGLWQQGIAGDMPNSALYVPQTLPPEWSVGISSGFGTGSASRGLRGTIEALGIDTSHSLETGNRQPGLYMIHLTEGKRSLFYWRSHSAARLLANIRSALWPDRARMVRRLDRALEVSSIALPSFDDEARFFGDAGPDAVIRRTLSRGPDMAVVKDGPKDLRIVTRLELATTRMFGLSRRGHDRGRGQQHRLRHWSSSITARSCPVR
jgi:2-dehydro-3-deoxygluconokinase